MSLHIVDNDGHLQSEKQLNEFLKTVVEDQVRENNDTLSLSGAPLLSAVGMNYHVIGVFGGQSSGKSTLLNHLFATDFQTLDETVRRGQTTKGAFVARANTTLEGFEANVGYPDSEAAPQASSAPEGQSSRLNRAAASANRRDGPSGALSKSPLLVFDFEGTDGLERGEDQSFERQLSLFGLSVADTLIVNMWAVDVGRFNAANLSLLRTIFEVNLQLFSHDNYESEEKPTLLIILRDFTEEDPAPSLTTVRKSFDTIWENITRPPQFEDASIDALFHLKYYVMPHYRLQKEEFKSSVAALRRWFGDGKSQDYLFRHQAMFRGVPLEGLPAYLTNCWDAIRTSKDLDIPTQRQMLAVHRCREAKEHELSTFLQFTRHYEDRVSRGEMLLRLSEVLDEEMDVRLKAYYKQTKLYSTEVVSAHAIELEKELVDATMKVVNLFSKAIAAEVLSGAETRVLNCVDGAVKQLLKAAQILPFTKAPAEEAEELAEGENGTLQRRPPSPDSYGIDSAECQHLVQKFWKGLCRSTNEIVEEMSVQPPPAHLYGRYTTLVAQDPTARDQVINVVVESIYNKLRSRIASMADSACETAHSGFERCLTHNNDGTVRFFATAKGLQKVVPSALQGGLVLLGCLIYFPLKLVQPSNRGSTPASRSARRVADGRRLIAVDESSCVSKFYLSYNTLDTVPKYPLDVPVISADAAALGTDGVLEDSVLLSQASSQRAYELYKQKCDFTTQLQLRSVEAGRQRLPAWVIPALLILGWNEILFVATSPALLICLIVICVVFFQHFFISQWQLFEETGPATIVVPLKTLLHTVRTVAAPLMPGGGAAPADGTSAGAAPSAVHQDPATKAHRAEDLSDAGQSLTSVRRRTARKDE